jgi:hypothetical protein
MIITAGISCRLDVANMMNETKAVMIETSKVIFLPNFCNKAPATKAPIIAPIGGELAAK